MGLGRKCAEEQETKRRKPLRCSAKAILSPVDEAVDLRTSPLLLKCIVTVHTAVWPSESSPVLAAIVGG